MSSLVRWLNWMTEKSAASEACLPSFPTIPTPMIHYKLKSNKGKDVELTNVSSLDHADVISSIPDAAYSLLGMFSNKTSDVSLLGRRTPTGDHRRELGSDLDEFVREQVQTELSGPLSLALSETGGDTHLKRFSVDDKTAIQFRLQELQLIPNLVRSLDYSPGFEYTKRVSLDPTSHRKGTRVSRLDECTGSWQPTWSRSQCTSPSRSCHRSTSIS